MVSPRRSFFEGGREIPPPTNVLELGIEVNTDYTLHDQRDAITLGRHPTIVLVKLSEEFLSLSQSNLVT